MRILTALLCSLAIAAFLLVGVQAQEGKGKEVTIKGKITCAKCELGKEAKCATVIVEKKDNKDIIYYFDTPSHKKYHGDICSEGKAGSVVGVVSEKGDKKLVSVNKLEYK
jgi:hypothetical protein